MFIFIKPTPLRIRFINIRTNEGGGIGQENECFIKNFKRVGAGI
jgi:hypothetical protein